MRTEESDIPLLTAMFMDSVYHRKDRGDGIVLTRFNNHMLNWFMDNGYHVDHVWGETQKDTYVYVWI